MRECRLAIESGTLAALRTGDAGVVRLPGGHHLHMDQPEAVGAVLAPFLDL